MAPRRKIKIMMEFVVIFLHCRGPLAETTRKIRAFTGTNVTLSCLFDKSSGWVQRDALTVEWNVVDKRSDRRIVYTFEDGHGRPNRNGALVDETELLQSDASLRLPDVKVEDEGVYSCRVITPVVYTESTSLEVLARPSVSLPEKATVVEGEERTLQCDITGFYPEKLDITWQIQSGSQSTPAVATHLLRVCTEMAVLNANGTYSLRSGITVPSSAVKGDELKVICQISHPAYNGLHSRTATLRILAPKEPVYHPATMMGVTSFISLLSVFFGIGAILFIYRHFHRVPPSVSDISKPSIIYASVPAELKCTIRQIRRRHLKVKWHRISQSVGQDSTPVSNGKRSEAYALLASEDLSEQADVQSEGSCHVSILTVCLTLSEDPAMYQCVVLHRGKKITRETVVSVTVQPSFLWISSIPQIPKVERLLVLCCRIENFYPGDLRLEWYRDDGEPVHTVTTYGPFADLERLYSVWSKIQLLMAQEDEKAEYTCRVYHCSFPPPGYRDTRYHINTRGTPPDLTFIKCEPASLVLGEECTLNICIKDFCPEDITVTWFRDGERVLSGIFNTPPSLNVEGLYSMWSFLKLTPTEEDGGSEFRCQVVHGAQAEPERRVFTLPHLETDGQPRD